MHTHFQLHILQKMNSDTEGGLKNEGWEWEYGEAWGMKEGRRGEEEGGQNAREGESGRVVAEPQNGEVISHVSPLMGQFPRHLHVWSQGSFSSLNPYPHVSFSLSFFCRAHPPSHSHFFSPQPLHIYPHSYGYISKYPFLIKSLFFFKKNPTKLLLNSP